MKHLKKWFRSQISYYLRYQKRFCRIFKKLNNNSCIILNKLLNRKNIESRERDE
jgi:hypothetical protein